MNIIIPIVIVLILWTIVENTMLLTVRRENFCDRGIKIAHVADLHRRSFGKDNRRITDKISAEKPDLILISGDLVSRDCTDFTQAESLLTHLCRIAPVYMVFGNHETDLDSEYKKELVCAISRSGAQLINNKSLPLNIRDRSINLCGLELEDTVYKKNEKYRDLDTLELTEILEKLGNKPDGETILLVHSPFFAEVYAQWEADYAVSGHVHGGVAQIPFTSIGILSPERKFFPKYSKGVYTTGKTKLLLSAGLGKLRLFNPPEIVIYEL